jgi:hypothetical protein
MRLATFSIVSNDPGHPAATWKVGPSVLLHSGNDPANSCRSVTFSAAEMLSQISPTVHSSGGWRVLPMYWVRTNRRWSTWLALAAMALQLVLSFGHIHLEKLASSPVVTSVAAAKAPSSKQNPAQHPANEADHFCAICATIHLASSSFLPDAPSLPVPSAFRKIEHFGHFNFIFVSPQRAAFQSRAPPLA